MLISAEHDRAVAAGVDIAGVVTYKYRGGFPEFTEWALPTLSELLDTLDAGKLREVRYRYENQIEVDTSRGLALAKMFRLDLPRAPEIGAEVYGPVQLHWRSKGPTGSVLVSLELEQGSKALNLTIVGSVNASSGEPLEASVSETHRLAHATFEHLITDEYRARLRGGGS